MAIKKISIRDLAREGKKLAEYDFVDIEDKKSKQYRGIFISNKYADEVKKFLKEKRKKRADKMMRFAGMANGLFKRETVQSIKSKKKK